MNQKLLDNERFSTHKNNQTPLHTIQTRIHQNLHNYNIKNPTTRRSIQNGPKHHYPTHAPCRNTLHVIIECVGSRESSLRHVGFVARLSHRLAPVSLKSDWNDRVRFDRSFWNSPGRENRVICFGFRTMRRVVSDWRRIVMCVWKF